MRFTEQATDPQLEAEGVWVEVQEGVRLCVARIGHPAYEQYVRRISAPHRALLRSENPPAKLVERLVIDAMAHHVLKGWEGLEDEDGTPLAYTPENAKKVLSVRYWRDLVSEVAESNEAFRRAEIEEGKETSPKPSRGNSRAEK